MSHVRTLQDSFEFCENVTHDVSRYETAFEIFHAEYEGLFHDQSSQDFLSAIFWAGGL
jgi:hypothetical protein